MQNCLAAMSLAVLEASKRSHAWKLFVSYLKWLNALNVTGL